MLCTYTFCVCLKSCSTKYGIALSILAYRKHWSLYFPVSACHRYSLQIIKKKKTNQFTLRANTRTHLYYSLLNDRTIGKCKWLCCERKKKLDQGVHWLFVIIFLWICIVSIFLDHYKILVSITDIDCPSNHDVKSL